MEATARANPVQLSHDVCAPFATKIIHLRLLTPFKTSYPQKMWITVKNKKRHKVAFSVKIAVNTRLSHQSFR
jgi:hypothetical protein